MKLSATENKLKVNLKLSINRIKMATAKQESLQQHARREIAGLLLAGKVESARIKVEHIIRQDYNKEAMEMIELFCDLLLARFPLLIESKQCDSSLQEAVHTLMYSASRSEIKELLDVRDLLTRKFGKEFGEAALANRFGLVNPKVLQRLHIVVPDPAIVDAYLVEIAAKFSAPYTPLMGAESEPQNDVPVDRTTGSSSTADVHEEPSNSSPALKGPAIPKLPEYDEAIDEFAIDPTQSSPEKSSPTKIDFPEPPEEPSSKEPDFDDLAKRFEQLRKKK